MDFASREGGTNAVVQSLVQFQWRLHQHGGYGWIMNRILLKFKLKLGK